MARLVMAVIMAVFCMTAVLYAAYELSDVRESKAAEAKAKGADNIVEVGNTICPVTGDKVDGKSVFITGGKRYNLCCPACENLFRAYPERYSEIADKSVSGEK